MAIFSPCPQMAFHMCTGTPGVSSSSYKDIVVVLILRTLTYSVTSSCPTLCHPMNCSMPDFPVLHCLLGFAQTHVHRVSDVIQLSHPQWPPFLALNLSQHQDLFQWVGSSHQVTKVLELQLQHQFFQWIFRVYFLWDGLVCSPCSPRDSQESSPAPQFKGINL